MCFIPFFVLLCASEKGLSCCVSEQFVFQIGNSFVLFQIANDLQLSSSIRDRKWQIQACSAITKEGIKVAELQMSPNCAICNASHYVIVCIIACHACMHVIHTIS